MTKRQEEFFGKGHKTHRKHAGRKKGHRKSTRRVRRHSGRR